ncbi:hypothetical protein LKR43_14625 [Pusillimonas sp. MFBS29]|uniref:hypothetical protein n=1 Tax=Pusillimonas sp. MFBS29 TaxID=2886690 RepID=UPI001D0F6693|nr:hypothetical protein [Pusillimonas sp. MFBS29]MCC2597568.1 hypothetical protein [Pusillimonas sp. MFBS29]
MVASSVFDPEFYLKQNPDVAEAVHNGWMTALSHFEQYGMSEDRSPFSLFNAEYYLAQNPDVAAAVKLGHISAVQHFMLYGSTEVRDFGPLFDVQSYLDANPDVAAAVEQGQLSPLQHFLAYGVAEARDLGNGVNLAEFDQDPVFSAAVAAGDLQGAVERLGDVIPFLPSFIAPTGWQVVPIDTLTDQDFVLPAWMGPGVVDLIQDLQSKIVTSGLVDPENLNPDGTVKDPSELVELVIDHFGGPGAVDIIGDLTGGFDIPMG